jgi:tRNA G37 N-methylase TrmD
MGWDNDDDTVNDMYVTALGAFVVRIHGDETVTIGDYLQSKGDGTAKVQADDILRASTIAKVTSTEKTHTYDDGSYCVPCTLHCG